MKAVVCTECGPPDVLQLKEIAAPTPKDDEALVRVHAASVNAADLETLRGDFIVRMAAPRKPMHEIPGTDIAGTVEAVGGEARQLRPGDEVWADLSEHGWGAFAEYINVPEDALRPKPASMTFEEAAAYPRAAILALQYLRGKRPIEPGQEVLINGAGGGVGTFAVQIAKHFGAEVTGVDSATKLDMLRSIGADHVIDYTRDDFTESGETYDVVFDVVGKASFSRCMRSLGEGGFYLSANPGLSQMIRGRWTSIRGSKKAIMGGTAYKTEDLVFLRELIEAGNIRSIIDRSYPLDQIPEAHRYVEKGAKKGNVVITVTHNDDT